MAMLLTEVGSVEDIILVRMQMKYSNIVIKMHIVLDGCMYRLTVRFCNKATYFSIIL